MDYNEKYLSNIIKNQNFDNIQEINTGNNMLDYYLMYGLLFGIEKLKAHLAEWEISKKNWKNGNPNIAEMQSAISILERRNSYGKN